MYAGHYALGLTFHAQLHLVLYGPSLLHVPAIDLGAHPVAVLGYTFFLVLGVGLVAAAHHRATRVPSLD